MALGRSFLAKAVKKFTCHIKIPACLFGIASLILLSGCKKVSQFQTIFPLTEDAVSEAMVAVGLEGYISGFETSSQTKNDTHYVIRNGVIGNHSFVASIVSAEQSGQRLLYATFDQAVDSDQIQWDAWKQHIVFASQLYGGFEHNEVLYEVFQKMDVSADAPPYRLEAQLTGGYCVLSYRLRGNTVSIDDGVPQTNQSATMRIDIYESYDLYQEMGTHK